MTSDGATDTREIFKYFLTDQEKQGMETVPKDKYTPLKGYIIYFDLKCIPQKYLLYELFRRLGGTIEEFLSKDINCVITDKNLKKINRGSHGDQPSSASTPSPHGSSLFQIFPINFIPTVILEEFHLLPKETLLSHNKRIQTTLFRGKDLVDRANKTQQKGTTDVLEFSKQWGIRVVNLHSVLEWLEKLRKKKLINIKDKRKLSERNGYSCTTSDIIRFHGPYIKVEDINNNYRPQNKNLGQWPELNLTTLRGSCPFPVLNPSGLNKKQTSDFIIRRNKTTENSKFNLKILSKIQQRKTQLSASGYCEICCCHFTNQQKHVTTENHKDILLNSENFNHLRKELAELFSIQKFLSKVESSTQSIQSPFKQGNSTKLVCDPAENIPKIPQVNEISFGKNEKHKMISSTLTHCKSQDIENWETSINLKKCQN
ncbi:protein DBF4 homolog A-like [Tachypleus tridentatus]|uniref:protein DBF4 homolog A-like n=1 Tax=Tachypleus tridentatus TaxID=6853 RepID=UPI003FD5D944